MDKESEFSKAMEGIGEFLAMQEELSPLLARAYEATMTEAKKAEVAQEKIFSEVLNEQQVRLRGLPVEKGVRTRSLIFTVKVLDDGTTMITNRALEISVCENTLGQAFKCLGNILKRKKVEELRKGLE